MPEPSHESKIIHLEKQHALLSQRVENDYRAFKQYADETKEGIKVLGDKFELVIELMNKQANMSYRIEVIEKNIESIMSNEIKPMKETVNRLKGIGFVAKNISIVVTIIGAIVAATVYYMK